jgi:hypothetical protein
VRIDFRVEGGFAAFPGLARPVTLHCDTLPPAEREKLRQLVERADFFALPAQRHAQPDVRDARSYTIEIDDGQRCRSVTVHEPIADPALRALVDELRGRAAIARRTR